MSENRLSIENEIYLRREGKSQSQSIIPINEKQTKFGACKDSCSVVLKGGKKVSRTHCSLWMEENCVYITDSKSKHGTFVNDTRINSKQKLEVGDLIGFGLNPLPQRDYDETQFVYSLQTSRCEVKNVDFDHLIMSDEELTVNIEEIIKSLEEDLNDEECGSFKNLLHNSIVLVEPDKNVVSENRPCQEILSVATSPELITKPIEVPQFYDKIDQTCYDKYTSPCSVKMEKLTTLNKLYETVSLAKFDKSRRKRKYQNDSKETVVKKIEFNSLKSSKKLKTDLNTKISIKKQSHTKSTTGNELSKPSFKKTLNSTKNGSKKTLLESSKVDISKKKAKGELNPMQSQDKPRAAKNITKLEKKKAVPVMETRGKLSPLSRKCKIISASPSKPLKSILKSKKSKASRSVTFCNSIFIKRFTREPREDQIVEYF